MKRLSKVGFIVSALVLAAGLVALGMTANFAPSNYNPAIGESVTFTVCQSCLGSAAFRYEWDFDGDGLYEVSAEDSFVEWTFTEAGYVEVTLKVVDAGGRTAVRRKGILVGESPLFAVRDVLVEQEGTVFVLITVGARMTVSALGLEEAIPMGWQVEILESGGTFVKRANGTLEVLWMNPIEAGKTVTFSYRLYPSYGSGLPALRGAVSGYVPKRAKAPVCGDLSISP